MSKVFKCLILLVLACVIQQGSSHKIRFCVERQVELNKCNAMTEAIKKHNLNADFECSLDDLNDCMVKAQHDRVDALVCDGHSYSTARAHDLEPVLFEAFGPENVMVAIADPQMTKDQIKDAPVEYDIKDLRESHAAMFLNKKRGSSTCGGLKAGTTDTLKIVNSADLSDYDASKYQLICPNLDRKSLSEFKTCNIEANLVNAVFIHKSSAHKSEIIDAFKLMVENFGPSAPHKADFEIFGHYKSTDNEYNSDDVIFSDDAVNLIHEPELPNGVNEKVFESIHCHAEIDHHGEGVHHPNHHHHHHHHPH